MLCYQAGTGDLQLYNKKMANSRGIQIILPVAFNLFFLLKIIVSEDVTSYEEYYSDLDDQDNSTTVDYGKFEQQCHKGDIRSFRAWFLPIVYAIICFVGLLGNLLVMLTYIYFKRLKTMTDVYLLNLAAADILFLLTLPFWAISFSQGWIFGLVACKMVYYIYKVSFFSGMLLLMCISADRYFAIACATSAHRHRSRAIYFSKVSCVCLWILALIFSLPELVYSTLVDNSNFTLCMPISEDSSHFKVKIQSGQMVAGFVLPLLVMFFCYIVIIQTLLQARSFEKNKAIKVVFAVVLVFITFQLPYNGVMLMRTIALARRNNTDCQAEKQLDVAEDITKSLALLRCCLNPFLYAFIGVKFRNDLLKLLKEIGCMSQEQFFRYTSCKQKRSSFAMETTETSTTFSP
ncbi:C-C chemokine receptor type 7-like [Polyodon spathula]|uniref:C-C chemokine receptor type 7-like n=1 Tax=Polyodon spathula TaxID=7913 RepID=UPI001B7F1CFB|nr:C-C chemokine receptor type 7-like [Polyodon spathula]